MLGNRPTTGAQKSHVPQEPQDHHFKLLWLRRSVSLANGGFTRFYALDSCHLGMMTSMLAPSRLHSPEFEWLWGVPPFFKDIDIIDLRKVTETTVAAT